MSAALPGLLRALAHDCESTDGWEGAAPDLHAAADRLLILEMKIDDLVRWARAQTEGEQEEEEEDFGRGWVAGYTSAANTVRLLLKTVAASAIETEGQDPAEGLGAEHESAAPNGGDAQ